MRAGRWGRAPAPRGPPRAWLTAESGPSTLVLNGDKRWGGGITAKAGPPPPPRQQLLTQPGFPLSPTLGRTLQGENLLEGTRGSHQTSLMREQQGPQGPQSWGWTCRWPSSPPQPSAPSDPEGQAVRTPLSGQALHTLLLPASVPRTGWTPDTEEKLPGRTARFQEWAPHPRPGGGWAQDPQPNVGCF